MCNLNLYLLGKVCLHASFPRKIIYFLLFISIFQFKLSSQCSTIIQSSDGYSVSVELMAVNVLVDTKKSCENGFKYSIETEYNVLIYGKNAPEELYTLQANLICADGDQFFALPKKGGSGTTVANGFNYTFESDCESATPESLLCNTFEIIIQGPGISYQHIECGTNNRSSLPVEFSSFKGKSLNNQNVINWSTSSEINNDYFEVLRSDDNRNWDIIGKVNGQGHSSAEINYEFIDRSPISQSHYYKLLQVDFNGSYSYSDVISVKSERIGENEISVFPNPVADVLTIRAENISQHELAIYDMTGQKIPINVNEMNSNNMISVNISDLRSGTYFLRFKNSTQTIVKI